MARRLRLTVYTRNAQIRHSPESRPMTALPQAGLFRFRASATMTIPLIRIADWHGSASARAYLEGRFDDFTRHVLNAERMWRSLNPRSTRDR